MSKIIAHIDLNAFFATAEEARNPSLKNKPIIVGHPGRRGVVSTANYEARKYGVHSGMPTFEALSLCPSLVIVPCDFDYYEMLSNSFFTFLKRITPLVEQASIDEGYLDLTEILSKEKEPLKYLLDLQNELYRELDLKCSIGVAPTKFLAKMASDMKKPMGITILRKKDLESVLYPLPIDDFFGIGKKTSPYLKKIGILTIGDLKKAIDKNENEIRNIFGKSFNYINDSVNGRGSDEVVPIRNDPKSIGRSETFPSDTNDFEEISYKISELAREVTSAAKREGKKGKTVSLVVKDTNFQSHDKSVSFSIATFDFDDIYDKAIELYEKNFLGMVIRLVGVTLSNLINPKDEIVQMSFWNYSSFEEMDKTKLLINEFNRQMKKDVLFKAKELKK